MRKRSLRTRPISGSAAPTTDGTGPWGSPSSMRTGSGRRTRLLRDETTISRAAGKRPESESAAYIRADLALECALQVVQLRPQRPVEDDRADLGAHTAQNFLIHAGVEDHLLLHDV